MPPSCLSTAESFGRNWWPWLCHVLDVQRSPTHVRKKTLTKNLMLRTQEQCQREVRMRRVIWECHVHIFLSHSHCTRIRKREILSNWRSTLRSGVSENEIHRHLDWFDEKYVWGWRLRIRPHIFTRPRSNTHKSISKDKSIVFKRTHTFWLNDKRQKWENRIIDL